jgi:hypothetical protein
MTGERPLCSRRHPQHMHFGDLRRAFDLRWHALPASAATKPLVKRRVGKALAARAAGTRHLPDFPRCAPTLVADSAQKLLVREE